jgi:hypothetical protein
MHNELRYQAKTHAIREKKIKFRIFSPNFFFFFVEKKMRQKNNKNMLMEKEITSNLSM